MMGRSHVTVGACTACVATAAQLLPWTEPRLGVVITGMVLAGNLAPDLDSKKSAASTCWGPISWMTCRLVRLLARWIYLATRTPHDPRNRDPHRTASHTWPGALVFGGCTAMAMMYGGPVVATALAAMATGLAGYAYDKGLRWYGALAGGACAWPLAPELITGHAVTVATIGAAMAIGCLTHCAADCTTKMGNPWSFPRVSIVKVLRKDGTVMERRQRWYMSGPPAWVRYETGGGFEKWFVRFLIGVSLTISWWLVTHIPHWSL